MRLTGSTASPSVSTAAYRLHVDQGSPWARLEDGAGEPWADLALLGSADTLAGPDETASIEGPVTSRSRGGVRLTWRLSSERWRDKRLVIDCDESGLDARLTLAGDGRLTDLTLLGGHATMPTGVTGPFWSGRRFETVFSPAPGDPRAVARPAGRSSDISAAGGSEPGRGQWFFTPAPMVYAVSRTPVRHPAVAPDGPWLTFGLAATPADQRFLGFGYRAQDLGFRFVLDYQGRTRVRGTWESPAVSISPAGDPWSGIARYRQGLERRGLVPRPSEEEGPAWWRQPIFSGWGAQCAAARASGRPLTDAPAFSTQRQYDTFLADLGGHGVHPGTIVIDDKWQAAYGLADPDPAKWPDLAGWIAARHAQGRRVVLWWKAWDPEGLPPDQCVRTSDGVPVAIDPNHAAARRELARAVRTALSPHGLGADGLQLDFTGRTPSGASLRGRPGAWGMGLLRRLLSTIHEAAKAARPDALLIGHVPEPSLAPLLDMIRLNDMLRLDDPAQPTGVVAQMAARAATVRAACPDHVIDTDDWCAPDLAAWRAYARRKPDLGVPAVYYSTGLDRSGERFEERDYALLRRTWAAYRRREGLDLGGAGSAPIGEASP